MGYGGRGSANSKGNRSSPLYAICLDWINRLQFVDFDSNCSFTDVTVKLNRTGNIPRRKGAVYLAD
uniref:LIN37 n=1 Tax=Siphoviridae sp. ctnpt50 TaxID=2827941 RepID=A0A8S5SDV8_9CAUD|nr:MAG TPA: LIN37 [Siphoviridae sp. ctnpt50]